MQGIRAFISSNILLFFIISVFPQVGLSQVISLSFPAGVEVCDDQITLSIDIENTVGDTIESGTLALDLTGTPGLEYLSILMQTDGPTISEAIPGIPEFTFSNDFLDGENIVFDLNLNLGCEGATVAMPLINLNFDYFVDSINTVVDEDLSGFSINSPDIDISSSLPIGINGVIGYEFSILNTVENNGTVDADSVYYCVENNPNATLLNVEVAGIMLVPAATNLTGYSCFELGGISFGSDVEVVENWVISSCNAPVQSLFRKASFGCEGEIDCAMDPNSEFPSTVMTLSAPVSPLSITTTNATELYICGASDTICITVENDNGDDFVTRNAVAAISFPDGVSVDYSTLTTKTGEPVSIISGTDSILIGDLEDGESVTFSLELSIICDVSESNVDYTVDVVYDELCEGISNIESEISAQISVLAAEFSILSPLIVGNLRNENIFDAIINVSDTIKVPLINAGAGAIDSFTYFVVNPSSVSNVDVLIDNVPLAPLGTNGDTTFYSITSTDILRDHSTGGGTGNGNGSFDENESLIICEVWIGTVCEFGTPQPIRRGAQYGCGGVDVCHVSNISTTGIDYGFAIPDLTYAQYAPLIDRPVCYSESPTTLSVFIVNEGLAPAKDITLSISSGNNPGAIVGSSLMYSLDPSGPFTGGLAINTTPAFGSSGTSGQCTSGAGYFRTADAFLDDVYLQAGDTLYFTYQIEQGCDCRNCNIQNIHESTITDITWTDPCDLELVNNNNVEFPGFDATLQGFFEGESNVSGSGCISYQITSGFSTWMNSSNSGDYPDAYFESRVSVGCGIDITSAGLLNADGMPYSGLTIVQNTDNSNTGDDEVIFRIDRNVSGTIEICYNVDCSEKPDGCAQVSNFSMENFFFPAPACAVACEPNVSCESSFPFIFSCEPCEDCDGLSVLDLEINRANYCYLDANNDFIPDDGSLADATTAKSKRFVQGDTLKLEISAVVQIDALMPLVPLWDYAFLELDLQTPEISIIGAEFSVYDFSTLSTLTCNSLSQFAIDSTLITDLSIPSMTGLGCTDFDGFQYSVGDTLYLTVYYSSKEPLNNIQYNTINIQPDFYLSDAPYDMGTRYSCNFLIETLNQIGIRTVEQVNISGQNFGGCDPSPFSMRYDLNYGNLNFDEFCNEIRSPGIPEKFFFVKPTELEYSLEDFGLTLTQRIGTDNTIIGMQSGGIPQSFFLQSGDTLCFFVKNYMESLGLSEITDKGIDGGYSINFYPGIRGNCLTEIESYAACASLLSDVDDDVFCVDKIQTDFNCQNFEYTGGPVLIATSPTAEVELFEPTSCITIDLVNLSNINAPFSWLNIQSLTGGLVVTSLREITGGADNLITPTSFGLYQLDLTDAGSSRRFELCVNTTDCSRQTLSFASGWDCTAYPTTIEEATCNAASTIDFVSVKSAYTGQLIKPLTDQEYDLCDTICFIHRFSSTALGNIKDIVFDFQLPGGTTYVPNSFEIAYPIPPSSSSPGDTMWVHVSEPINTFGNTWRSDVTSQDNLLDSIGLIGSLGALQNLNIVLVRWNAVTTCDFVSGTRARFVTNAANSCGDPLPSLNSRGPRILIKDAIPEYEIDLTLNDLTLNPCNGDNATVSIEMEIDASDGVMTSATDTIKISLPLGISYEDMSYVPIENATVTAPIEVDDNGVSCLFLPVVEGLMDGDVIAFDIDIMSFDAGQSCGISGLIVQTFSTTNSSCDGVSCSINVLSGEDEININLEKPDLTILTTDLTLISMPPASASIDYEIKIMNNGAVPQQIANELVIEFWDDVDDNGFLDTLIDNKISNASNNVSIPTGSMTLVSGTIAVPPTGICNALVVLNPNSTCVCNLAVSNQTKVSIENEFEMEVSACSGASISVGPDSLAGFDYEWVSIDGSNLAALSSTVETPTDFQFTNTSGSNIIWDFALRSSFGECYSYDSLQVTIFPQTMSSATVPGCEGDSLLLPGPISGSDFLWTPVTDLDDPTLSMPYLNPVASGTTIYNLAYTDDNGCSANKEVTVNGVACAPGTALGDTVWFDLNENGLQDLFEPPIPNVVVYLYASNNVTPGNHIAVTTTDINGFYIFENLVAGNYIVEFVMPDGFIFTSRNTGGDDTVDSDPSESSGLTDPYFLPNGTYNPTIDAGFIPDCSLEVLISDVSDCIYDGSTHTREVTVDITWTNAVHTYDFLEGSDTIQLDILGQTFQYRIDTLSGDTSQIIILNNSTPIDIIADAVLLVDNDCVSSDTILGVLPCIYDVALIKEVMGFGPYKYGDTLTFNITVANQGSQDLNNIKINDYLPSGFSFIAASNPNWTQTASDTLMYIITDTLAAGETTIIPLDLELVMSSIPDAYLNTAEVFSFTDTLGVDRSDQDIDSTPDNDPTNDGGGVVNSGSDNSLDGDGTGDPGDTNPNTDEDDQDPELITVVDLALVKDILTPGPYDYGDTILFQITVTNQGNVTAYNIKVNDFIPNGFGWDTSNEPNWTLMGSTAMDTIPGPISTGQNATTTISLILQMADPDQYVNIAEIGYFEDDDGNDITDDDIDSQADNDPTNDSGGNPGTNSDGSLNGNGTGAPQDSDSETDEDDSDPAYISIPQIDLEKSTISVVPAQSGIDGNFDATFEFVITNPGNEKLTCIQLQDDLTEQLGGTYVGITSSPVIVPTTDAAEVPAIVMGYNGGVIDTIFNGTTGCLNPSETITVQMTIELNSLTGPDPIINAGDVIGKSPNGVIVMDTDTALVDAPDCFLSVVCPLEQVNLACINDVPPTGTTVAWFNGIDGLSAIENSCGIPTVTVNDINNGGTGCVGDPYILTRQIIINDPGDGTTIAESDTCNVTYTVIDDVKPLVMNSPQDLILHCEEDNTMAITNWVSSNGGGMFFDDCGTVSISRTSNTPIATCGNTTTTIYTFTATDPCGNSVTESASIILVDAADPTLILPSASNTAACDASPDPAAWAATASATDDCDDSPIVDFALINVAQLCVGTQSQTVYTYSFTAIDDCGNMSLSQTATYTVTDALAPMIEAPADLSISCGQDISLLVADWIGDYTVSENCDSINELVVTTDFDASTLMDACGSTVPVTWTVVDACGGMNSAMANIVIDNDTQGPIMMCEDSLTFNVDVGDCGSIVNLPLPLATDCNGIDSVKQISPLLNSTFPIGFTTVTFMAWDGCGNTTTCETVVEIIDTATPDIVCPPSVNQCADLGTCTWIADATVNPVASDCASLTLTYSVLNPDLTTSTPASIVGYAFMLGSSIVTVTATEDTAPMNSSTCNFTVTITDCEAPIITTCPADQLMVECGLEDIDNWADALVAIDFCDATLTTRYYIIEQTNSCGFTNSSTYIFVVTDDAGNSTTCSSIYTTVDSSDPSIDTPANNPIVSCSTNNQTNFLAWLNANGGAAASDGCGSPITWTNDWDGSLPTGCLGMTSIAVTFTATDPCNNSITTTGTYTITDSENPVLNLPENLNLECGNGNNASIVANWLSSAVASDICSDASVSNNYSMLPTTCNTPVTVTFMAVDSCGNSSMDTRTITLIDFTNPVITVSPSDLIVQCGINNTMAINDWIMDNGGGMAEDMCDDPTITFVANGVTALCGGTSQTEYIFTATDLCSNSVSEIAYLITTDITDPSLILPTAIDTVDCDANPDIEAWAASSSTTDLCDPSPTVIYSLLNLQDTCEGDIKFTNYTYVFNAIDGCGNISDSQTATFTVVDSVAPELIAPANLEVSCGQDISLIVAEWLDDVVAMDNCDDPNDLVITNDFDASTVLNSCGATIPVTWTATSSCGGSASIMSNIIIANDNEGPVMTCQDSLTFAVNVDDCGANISLPLPLATDCNGVDSVKQISPLPNVEFTIGFTTVTFQSWDACGNTTTCETVIEIIDTENPELICPPSINKCADSGTCAWISDASVNPISSDCGSTTLTYSVENPDGSINTPVLIEGYVFMLGSSIVTVTSTDDAAPTNMTTCNYTVTISDCEAPSIDSCPVDQLMVQCGSEDIATWAASFMVSDFCDSDLTTDYYILTQDNDCGSTSSTVYVFVVSDDAGNSASCTSTYTTIDTMDPTIDTPASNPMVNCMNDNQTNFLSWLNSNGGASASDVCSGPVVWTNNWDGILPAVCMGMTGITITFTATDDCGNVSTTDGIYTITDTEDPELILPDNLELECGNTNNPSIVTNWLNTVQSIDNCSMVDITNDFTTLPTICNEELTVTFTATDDCNNSIMETATITIIDNTAPSLLVPAKDTTVSCDGAGNMAELTAWLDAYANVVFEDNCTGALDYDSLLVETIPGCGMTTSYTYAFFATDDCDNISEQSIATFTVIDTTSPAVIAGTDLIVECDGSGNIAQRDTWLDNNGGATASDICSAPLTWNFDLITEVDSCGNTGSQTYLFTVTDDCGNTATTTANFIIQDTTPPSIVDQAVPFAAECNGASNSAEILAWLNDNGGASATEICGGITWTNDYGSIDTDCGTTGEVLVTFTATDDCGNAATSSATFTINDDTPPTWEIAPQNLTLECNDTSDPYNEIEAWLNIVGGGEAEDSCSLVVYSNDFSGFSDACGNTGLAIVTFTATDACGNITDTTAIVTLVDNNAPNLLVPAQDTTVSCDGAGNMADLTAWLDAYANVVFDDACSQPLDYDSLLMETIPGCGMTTSYTYAFFATDDCDNVSEQSIATFTVIDTTSPAVIAGTDLVVECDGSGNIAQRDAWLDNNGGATASDICSAPLTWNFDLITEVDSCGNTGSQTYLFTVTDDCGNTATTTANFIIQDTTPPSIVDQAVPFAAECNGASNSAEILAWLNDNGGASATEICGGITWTNDYGSIDTDCGTTGEVLVTFTATDDCGNAATSSATFTINDDTPPTWEIAPQNLTLECNDTTDPYNEIEAWLNIVGGGEAEDSCSLVVYSNDFSGFSDACGNTGSAIVTFTATDACGNTTDTTAVVTLVDNNAPNLLVPAQDTTVSCDGTGNMADLTAWLDAYANVMFDDACSQPLDYDSLLMETIPGCGMTTAYTYAFFATDDCDNVSEQSIATFTVIDTTSPAVIAGTDLVVECDGAGNIAQRDAWLDNNGGATASDICSAPLTWNFDLITEVDSCGNTGSQTYLFTVTDDCGNTATTTANFIIQDSTPPSIVGGEDYSGECDQSNANNDADLLSWLNNKGGASADDICGTITWSNNYNADNFVDGCNDSRNIDVTFTATDDCGNSSDIILNFSTGDSTPPIFTNCPRPPVIVDAPAGWCNSFVNFSLPTATDNCGIPIVVQTDTTGLSSGDLFPVGLTLLEFTATDSCGNSSICELKIIVNDFHTIPSIACPEDITIDNDPAMCGAVVDNIAPSDISDNCPDNLAVVYSITNESGLVINGGIDDASGVKFPSGISIVTYEIFDQPIVLITELVNDGGDVGIEISNIGPANVDLSCMNISREGAQDTTFNVPNGTVLNVGDVYTVFLDPVDPNLGVGYTIGLLDNILDGVAVNGYTSSNFTFEGDIPSSTIFRTIFPDSDSADDWAVGNSCAGLSFGMYNPELPVFASNGTTASLQSEPANSTTCSFSVTILDNEAPFCAELAMTDFPSSDTPITFTNGACATSIISVTDVFNVSDVNIIDLVGSYPEMSEVTVTLTSPEGTVVTLFDNLCAGTSDWDIDLDDQSQVSQASITCNPLGNGDAFQPLQSMSILYGEAAFGDWQLDIYASGNDDGELSTWTLQLSELAPYSQTDTTMVNDTLVCGAMFEWQHPFIGDNCEAGDITVQYIFLDGNSVVAPITIEAGSLASEFFAVGTTQVLYTLTDAAGNTSQCGFDVTVLDTEDPDLTSVFAATGLCQDITIQLEAGQCNNTLPGYGEGFPVNGGLAPLGSIDNCGVDSVSYNPPVEFEFPIGTTEVTITVYDEAGNETSCTFSVTVLEHQITNNQLACNGHINLSLGQDCTAEINADMILEGGPYGCYDNYIVTINGPTGEIGNSENGTNFVGLEHVGMVLEVTVCTPGPNPNCCSTTVLVELKEIPEIECAADTIISCNMATNPEFTGTPTILTCEQEFSLTYFDDYQDFGPCGEPRARITRHWTVTDESNNVVTCTQIIDIEQFDTDDIEFPENYTIETALDCALVANDPSQIHPDSTGYPTINGLAVPLSTNGLCMLSWNWDDQILFSCQGSYEILRKWFVRDMCEDVQIGINPIEHYQIIKIIDNEGPNLHECPDDITISTDPWSCTGTYELDDIISSIDDNCGGLDQVQVSVNGGTVVDNFDGTYTITNMNKGNHLVRVRARDYCFNYSTCEFSINVVDGTAPVVTCTQFINVSLTTDGKAKIYIESVDAGSFDNCTNIRRELFRMDDNCGIPDNLEPGVFVEFCCEDIDASPIMVALQVWDDANMDGIIGNAGDNSSLCMVEVTVEEKIPPALQCPADITLECDADIEDLSVTGEPEIIGICLSHTAEYQDFVTTTNDCGAAIITRRWSVVDRPEVFCNQIITLETGEPFNGNIQWPADWEGACLDNIPQNEPIFLDGVCDQVAFTAETDTFDFVEGVCYKLIKEWTVIDWCQYEPNNPNTGGIWYYTQIIKISDETAPEIQDCEDFTIDLIGENCIQDIEITNQALDSVCGINAPIRWAYQLDINADGIWDMERDYNDVSEDILEGSEATVIIKDATPSNYKIIWKAFDGCGNVGTCQQDFEIRDGKAPTPYCYAGLVTVLMQDVGTISIDAVDFNLASFDNCTAEEDLTISFSGDELIPSMEFTCDDIENGVSQVFDLEVWVWDEAGNKDFCAVSVEIQDNLDVCQDTSSNLAIISGLIATEQDQGVNEVDVLLESFAPEYPHTNITGEDGRFYFLYNPEGYDYKATAERNTDYREGVSTLDLVMVQRHILGLEQFDSPYKIIAGDVTDDEALKASDILSMRKLILGITNDFKNKSWRFVDAEYLFTDITSPFPYSENIKINDLMDNINNANLVAVKIGDVNGSASTQLKQDPLEIAPRTNQTHKLILEKIEIDGISYIEVRAHEDGLLFGFQFGAQLDGMKIEGIQGEKLNVLPEMISNTSDKLRISWSENTGIQVNKDEVLFKVRVREASTNSTLFIDDNDIVSSEIYIHTLEVKDLELEWRNEYVRTNDFILNQNEPNPFIDETEVGFYLPEAGEITLTIYSVDGKILYEMSDEFDSGEQTISVKSEHIGVKGMVIYEVKGEGFKESRRMILVK